MTQSGPIVMGKPGSVWSVALSWIWERVPSSIHSLSPRNTAPNQTLASGLSPLEVGLVFKVMTALDLFLDCRAEPKPAIDLDAYLDSLGSAT